MADRLYLSLWFPNFRLPALALPEPTGVVVAFGRVALGTAILLPIAWQRGALRSLGKHKAAICA